MANSTPFDEVKPGLSILNPSSHSAGPSRSPLLSNAKSPTTSESYDSTASPSGAVAVEGPLVIRRVGGKANVQSACGPCKKAHLACDVARPCKRCVNMGKEDQCEDVPHKKRGRPKVIKPALGEPYSRIKPPVDQGGVGKWRGPSSGSYPPDLGAVAVPRPIDPELTWTSSAPLFTLFTTVDLKILRVSPACYPLTGYHPHEYVNSSMLDWLHPADRQVIDMERAHLTTTPFSNATYHSDRDTQAAITQRSERDLMTPAEGMREPYPNQNVRVLRSDNLFSLFNVRLHLGGGMGASTWQAHTFGRVYLVVSLLLITNQTSRLPPEVVARRPSPLLPPTPMTSVSSNPPPQPLPSFSSIAAAADATASTRYDPSPQPTSAYYPSPNVRPPIPPTSMYSNYPRAVPSVSTYPGRSPSPSSSYRLAPAYTVDYGANPAYHSPPQAAAQPPVPVHPQAQPEHPGQSYPYSHAHGYYDSRPSSDTYRRPASNEYGRRVWEL